MIRTLTILAALSCSAAAFAQNAQTPQGSADAGKAVFLAVGCWTCHGYNGQGASQTGPRIARTKVPFDAFLNQLRHPRDQMAPVPVSIVSDQQAADIYAYLQTFKRTDWKSIPQLQH